MKNVFFTLLYSSLFLNATAQRPFIYKEYYDTINKAELAIVELNFNEAYKIYVQVFERFEKRHLSDLHNASLCAILDGEYSKAKEWICEMIKNGVELNALNTRYFKKLPDSVWVDIKQNYNFYRQIYLSQIDSSYVSILDSLRKREQNYISQSKSQNTYDSLIYEHAKLLHTLISEKGISPVPIYDKRQYLPIDVLRHHFGLRNRLKFPDQNNINLNTEPYRSMQFAQYDLEPLLLQAVFNGELSPHFLGMAMSHSELDSTRQLGGFTLIVDLDTKTITYESTSKENLEQIDQYRKSIGLESIHDAIKKDIDIALYYNYESFPFDEEIRRNKEIGYTKEALKSIKVGTSEFRELSLKAVNVAADIRETFFRENPMEIKQKLDEEKLIVDNKWTLLKEFHLSQNTTLKMIIPPSE